tara:strand:+ start:3970 stop:4422 length:453 start_codon:yes stop_codon:yes gene_type:complete
MDRDELEQWLLDSDPTLRWQVQRDLTGAPEEVWTLREWGLDAAALAGTAEKLRENARWEYDDLPYWDGETDVCINAMTLANGAWLGADVSPVVEFFATKTLPDGGWNCEWVEGSTRSSFHSTINAVRGILAYEQLTGDDTLTKVRHRGEE